MVMQPRHYPVTNRINLGSALKQAEAIKSGRVRRRLATAQDLRAQQQLEINQDVNRRAGETHEAKVAYDARTRRLTDAAFSGPSPVQSAAQPTGGQAPSSSNPEAAPSASSQQMQQVGVSMKSPAFQELALYRPEIAKKFLDIHTGASTEERDAAANKMELTGRYAEFVLNGGHPSGKALRYGQAIAAAKKDNLDVSGWTPSYQGPQTDQQLKLAQTMATAFKDSAAITEKKRQEGLPTKPGVGYRYKDDNSGDQEYIPGGGADPAVMALQPKRAPLVVLGGEESNKKIIFKRYEEHRGVNAEATTLLDRYDAMSGLIDNVKSGWGAEMQMKFTKAARALGMDVDDSKLADSEAMRTLTLGFVMDFIQKTKGAISQPEMDTFTQASAGLHNTPAGNRLIIKMGRLVAKRKQEIARAGMAIARKTPNMDPYAYDAKMMEAQDRIRSKPLFTDKIRADLKLFTPIPVQSEEELRAMPPGQFGILNGRLMRNPMKAPE